MSRNLLLTSSLTLAVVLAATPGPACASPTEKIAAAEEAAATVTEEVAILKTNLGDIVLRLFPDVAPNHVANFKRLAANGVYDGTKFHRVIPGMMIQGGDPNSKNDERSDDGMGGAGPMQKAEFSSISHKRGILSTARKTGLPNSATSQFFIIVKDYPSLDGQYTVFGIVVEGMDVADRIVMLKRDRADNPLAENPAIIEKVSFETRALEPRPQWTRP